MANKNYLETQEGSLNLWRHFCIIAIWISPIWLYFSGTHLKVDFFVYFGMFLSFLGSAIALPLNHKFMGKIVKIKNLQQGGPFKYCRNPFYLGQTIFVLGFAIIIHCPQNIFAGVLLLVLTHLTVLKEEKKLQAKFGKQYLVYRSKVPRYFPSQPIKFIVSVFTSRGPQT